MITITHKNQANIAISETYCRHRELEIPKCDFLIHCGDFCTDGNESQIQDFYNWFSKTPATYKLLITGNHDYPFVFEPVEALQKHPQNIILMNQALKTINGITFYGLISDCN